MTSKINVAIMGIFYPVTMMDYIRRAFKRRDDVKLWSVGPYTGTWIPWNGGMFLPERYLSPPDDPLPQSAIFQKLPGLMVSRNMPWEPDLTVIVDAGWHPLNRPMGKKVILIKTDPHAIIPQHYQEAAFYCDRVYSMQTPYMLPGDSYLPYAYDPTIHYPEYLLKEYDVCLIGLQYQHRVRLIRELESHGMRVRSGIGIVFDEYRREYNKSKLALSLSSLQDTPTRVFEAMAMGIPLVANVTPDMATNGFEPGVHYIPIIKPELGLGVIKTALDNYDKTMQIGSNALELVTSGGYSWDDRVSQLIRENI